MSEASPEPATPPTDLGAAPSSAAAAPVPESSSSRKHLRLALIVISAAQLMVVLDASIVNVALPSIQRALHFGAANLVWVINGYTLTFGGLLLLGGRTGDLFGRRRMFMIGVGIFTAASLLGGLATTEGWLIGARMLQGAGGAIMAPTALSLIASTFPEGSARNRAMGVYAAMSGAGGAIGVLLGGVLTDTLSWRWVLFVNVPIGLALVFGAPRAFAETETRAGRLDLPGAVLATSGMSLAVYGLIHAASTSWGDKWTIAALVTGAVLLVGFLSTEARSRHALLPLRLFRDRNRATAYGIMLSLATAMFSMFYFLTLFFQEIAGFSPLRAGLAYLPFTAGIIVTATVVSRVVGRTGPKLPMMIGTTLGTTGLLWFSLNSASATYWGNVLPPMVLLACGMAMNFVPLTLTAVRGVARQDQGIASALLNSGQQVGGSLGLAVLGTVAIDVTRGKLDALGPSAARFVGAAPPPHSAQLPDALHHAIYSAYMSGYTTAFRVGAGLMFLSFLLASLVIRTPGATTAPAADSPPAEPELSPARA
jgi:EmrB/QacA subfamily drug resistance transporter